MAEVDNKEVTEPEVVETKDTTKKTDTNDEGKTFTREQLNTYIAEEKKKWKKDLEIEKAEAERLAKLSSEERFKEELRISREKENKATSELNAYQLKEQVIKDNKDIPLDLINLIDFKICNTAELVKEKIDTIKAVYKKSVEVGINETMKERTPKTVVNGGIETKLRTRTSY